MRDIQRGTALVVGVLLALVGLVGYFVANQVVGMGSNTLQDTVHLLTGLVGIWAFTGGWSRSYNRWAGAFYLIIGVLGYIAAGFFTNLFAANTIAHAFHLVIGAVAAIAGFALRQRAGRQATV